MPPPGRRWSYNDPGLTVWFFMDFVLFFLVTTRFLSFIYFLFMDIRHLNILLWNYRGAASSAFYRYCKQFVDAHRPEILVIMETRTDAVKLQQTFEILGFDGFLFSEVRGYSGGIIVAWRSDRVAVSLLVKDFQFLNLQVQVHQAQHWFFTAVYASPVEDNRRELWNALSGIADTIGGQWLVTGDFNDIDSPVEKKGGIPASQRRCQSFVDRINRCNLMDLGAVGSKYTWKGPLYNGHSKVYERLDRALCNDEWRLGFPNAFVKILTRVQFSDHHPVLVNLAGHPARRRVPLFRFESAWITHPEYGAAVRSCWADSTPMVQNLSALSDMFQQWKTHTFGNLQIKKRELLARLGGIQRKQTSGSMNPYLMCLETQLQQELDTILYLEELLWHQRSRTKWLADGDRNTRYYHLKTITRRRRNQILMLRNEQGDWVEDEDVLKSMVNGFYINLFSVEEPPCVWEQTKVTFPNMDD